MSLIFALIDDKAHWDVVCYERTVRQEFTGFHFSTHQQGRSLFGVVSRNQASLREGLFHSPEHHLTVCADAFITNREELLRQLSLPITLTSAALILEAYLHWGERCIEHLDGDFTFIIYDHRRDRLFSGRDRMGVRPLFYSHTDARIALASHPGLVIPTLPSMQLNEYFLRDVFTQGFRWGHPPHLETLFQHLHKLGPAHALHWSQKTFSLRKYWSFGQTPTTHSPSIKAAIRDFQDYLTQAVQQYTHVYHSIAVEMSGGLDSAAVAAYAKRLHPGLHILGVSNEDNCDFHHARALCDHLRIPLPGITSADYQDEEQMLPTLARWLRGSVHHDFALQHYPFYRVSHREGCPALFSGFGGDEFVSTRAWPTLRELKGNRRWLRYAYENFRKLTGASIVRRLGFSEEPCFIGNANLAPEILESLFGQDWLEWIRTHQQNGFVLEDQAGQERHYYEGAYANGFHGRLESSYLIARYFGVNYHFPLLDWQLVNYFHQLPSTYKRRHGRGRYLFWHALKDCLPPKFRNRNTKEATRLSAGVPSPRFSARNPANLYREARKQDQSGFLDHHINHTSVEKIFSQNLGGVRMTKWIKNYYLITMAINPRYELPGTVFDPG
ncbi:MAG: hypothetical protein HY540_08015 [Deltaproteobacteria bacterium]|nr:hypothetical protein [Deltaproteobacteria bacterium]